MSAMFEWVRHALGSRPIHGDRADEPALGLAEVVRNANQPRLEETGRRCIDRRVHDHPDDID